MFARSPESLTALLVKIPGLSSVCARLTTFLPLADRALLSLIQVYSLPSALSESARYEQAISALDSRRLKMLRRRLCDPYTYVVAATLDTEQIAGVSMWIPPKSQQRKVPWYFRLLGYFYKLYDATAGLLRFFPCLERYLYPTWPAVKQRLQALQTVDREIQQKVIPSDIRQQGYWTLALLGTSEQFGRRGVGSSLLRWGCSKADETDHAVFMTASAKGEQLYLKDGFEILSKELLFDKEPNGSIWQAYMMRPPKSRRPREEEGTSIKAPEEKDR